MKNFKNNIIAVFFLLMGCVSVAYKINIPLLEMSVKLPMWGSAILFLISAFFWIRENETENVPFMAYFCLFLAVATGIGYLVTGLTALLGPVVLRIFGVVGSILNVIKIIAIIAIILLIAYAIFRLVTRIFKKKH